MNDEWIRRAFDWAPADRSTVNAEKMSLSNTRDNLSVMADRLRGPTMAIDLLALIAHGTRTALEISTTRVDDEARRSASVRYAPFRGGCQKGTPLLGRESPTRRDISRRWPTQRPQFNVVGESAALKDESVGDQDRRRRRRNRRSSSGSGMNDRHSVSGAKTLRRRQR